MTAPKYVVVPVEPDSKILSAINLAEKYYSSFVWSKILGSLPDTGMVAVQRDWLINTLHRCYAMGWYIPDDLKDMLREEFSARLIEERGKL